jgi:5-methylcytosine-specific restriction enzyme A
MARLTDPVKRLRGYGLQKRNRRIFKAEPLCRPCKAKGKVRLAEEVDHILALMNGGTEDESNLQPVCKECNELKGIAERGDNAKSRELKGLDWIW